MGGFLYFHSVGCRCVDEAEGSAFVVYVRYYSHMPDDADIPASAEKHQVTFLEIAEIFHRTSFSELFG
jgi:hypothetical protein